MKQQGWKPSKTLPKRCRRLTGATHWSWVAIAFTGEMQELLMIRKSSASISVNDSMSLLKRKVIDLAKNTFPISQLLES